MNCKPGLIQRPVASRPHALLGSPSGYYPPRHIDRRAELLPASDQKNTSMCVAFALAGWLEFHRWRDKGITEQIDPAPIYHRAKAIDGMPTEEGTTLEAGLKAAQDLGLLAGLGGILEVRSLAEVKQALHRYGVVFGAFNATDLWSTPTVDGWLKPCGPSAGGHAVLVCGASEVDGPPYVTIQNSWGEDIGWRGFARMSPEQFQAEFIYGLVWETKL